MDDMAPWQHMTTFVVGLGLDSSLAYRSDYRTATEGDFWDIKRGVKDWPLTGSGTGFDYMEKINDMWHAAVNGRGTYFSAKNPQELVRALQTTLSTIGAAAGAGSAASLSNLQPVANDNYAYVASYRTVNWDGNLLAYALDPDTATLGTTPLWDAQTPLDLRITGACGDNSTSRTIYFTKPGATALQEFRWANLSSTQQGYFSADQVSLLSQFQSNVGPDLTQAAGATLVNYLRGENMNESKSRNTAFQTACPGYRTFYRARDHVLGDIVHAGPVYSGKPVYDYSDDGYATFKSGNQNRGTVYVGANDGMLHAFDATSGAERWAYIPPMVMPDLYKLADQNYAKKHQYYIDGPIITGDIKDGSTWKTILVGALGKGGRGIYALDVTSSSAPKPLWNFSAADDDRLGYTYGVPRITKLKDGTWVVVIASGYNNISSGDGKGRVFVLNAATGTVIRVLDTGSGSSQNPSGLATLNGYVPALTKDNTALRMYGGDLNGDLWGFDINSDSNNVYKIASGLGPITVPPQIAHVDSNVVLFFGSGRYLGNSDLAEQTGTIYAIKDKTIAAGGASTGASGTITTANLTEITGASTGGVNWSSGSGWYFSLPTGQRVVTPAQKYGSALLVAAIKPVALKSCEMGGSGYLYAFDAGTGQAANKSNPLIGEFPSMVAGITVFQDPDGQKGRVVVIGSDGSKTIEAIPDTTSGPGKGSGRGVRLMWHELTGD
jgi:type IV pilus assembly protein PilY1